MFELIAHRGFSIQAPENTLSAVEAAYEAGFPSVEVDIQLSKDGIPVVIHDEDLKKVAQRESKVQDLFWKDLKELDVGSWFDPKFFQERPPNLEILLQKMSHLAFKGRLYLDLKKESHWSDESVQKVLKDLESSPWQGDVVLFSFDVALVECFQKKSKGGFSLGYAAENKEELDKVMELTRGDEPLFINYHLLLKENPWESKLNLEKIFLWTVDEEEVLSSFFEKGFTRIITNSIKP